MSKKQKPKKHHFSGFVILLFLGGGIFFAYKNGLIQNKTIVPPLPTFNDCSTIEAEIKKYDWDTEMAFAVAKAESQCDVNAYGDEDLVYQENGRDYGYSVGAFQVRILPGREDCDSYNIETNVACAYKIYQQQNSFEPWSGYSTGKYKNYLWHTMEETQWNFG